MKPQAPFPLGEVLPSYPHGTVLSLPTLADVIGYERHDAATWATIRAGYPRFVLNDLVKACRDQAADKLGYNRLQSLALHSLKGAKQAIALAQPAQARCHDMGSWALLEVDPASFERTSKIIQHAGLRLASRAAEAWLTKLLLKEIKTVEPLLLPWVKPAGLDDLKLTPSGMNAVAAAIEAVRQVQRPHHRRVWLQLGWLYVDSSELLRKTLPADETLVVLDDVADLTALEHFFTAHQGKIAGVLAELPNNPGLASPQLAHLKKLAQAEGALLILDPSSSGLVNVDLMPYADVLVTSLTKYSGHRGDVMMGLIVVHPQGAHASALRKVAFDWVGPVAPGDALVLAEQLPAMEAVAALQNKNAQQLATFLLQHPAVARVLVADQGPTAAAYAQVARGPNRPGSLITFELKGDLASFYNAVDLVKGPSFGLDFTLLAPFLWLSHFEWVTQEAGRARIRQAGLSPDLIRLSVGTEDVAWIQARLGAALEA